MTHFLSSSAKAHYGGTNYYNFVLIKLVSPQAAQVGINYAFYGETLILHLYKDTL